MIPGAATLPQEPPPHCGAVYAGQHGAGCPWCTWLAESAQRVVESRAEAPLAGRTSIEIRLDAPETERIIEREIEAFDKDLFAAARVALRDEREASDTAERRREEALAHLIAKARVTSDSGGWLVRDLLDLMGIVWRE